MHATLTLYGRPLLTCNDDVLGCQRHKFNHHIIPERQVQDAKRPEVDRCSIGEQKAPHKLFVDRVVGRLINQVRALIGYVYVRRVCMLPVLQSDITPVSWQRKSKHECCRAPNTVFPSDAARV